MLVQDISFLRRERERERAKFDVRSCVPAKKNPRISLTAHVG